MHDRPCPCVEERLFTHRTVSGWSLARLLGGTIIIEKIFLVPSTGTFLLDAITARDYTLIEAISRTTPPIQ
jgi:peptide/nickel transport system permease protein